MAQSVVQISAASLLVLALVGCGGGGGGGNTEPPKTVVLKQDMSFGQGGSYPLEFSHLGGGVGYVLTLADGSTLLTGGETLSTKQPEKPPALAVYRDPSQIFIVKLLSSGQVDTSFGVQGRVNLSFLAVNHLSSIVIRQDGRIALTAYSSDECMGYGIGGGYDGPGYTTCVLEGGGSPRLKELLVQLTPDGQLDDGFGINGVIEYGNVDSQFGKAMSVYEQGEKLLVMRDVSVFGSPQHAWQLERRNADGSIDTSFGVDGGGLVKSRCLSRTGMLRLTSTGNMWVAGGGPAWCAEQLSSDGQPIGASVTQAQVRGIQNARAFGELSSGKLQYVTDVFSVRWLPDGHLDQAYGENGISYFDKGEDSSVTARSIDISSDGSVEIFAEKKTDISTPVWMSLKASGAVDTPWKSIAVEGSDAGKLALAGSWTPDGRGRWLVWSADAALMTPAGSLGGNMYRWDIAR